MSDTKYTEEDREKSLFSDLLQPGGSDAPQGPKEGSTLSSEDLVLPTYSLEPISTSPLGKGKGSRLPMISSGETKKKDGITTKDVIEAAVNAAIKRIDETMHGALDDIVRRLEGLEYRIEGVSQIVADLQETSSVRESAARERATSMEKSIREISRNVQILRDKAELAEANSELAKIASSASERKKLQNKEADLELPPREETYTKNEASSSSGQIKEDQENFKEEPEKQTGTATRQESISDSKSVTESVTRSDTQVAGSAPYAPPPVQAPAVPTGQMPPNAFQSQVNGQSAPSQSSVAIPCAPPPPPDNSTSVAAQIPLRRNIMPTQMVYKDSNGKGTEGNAAPIGSEHPSRLANPPLSQPLPPGYASIPPPPPNAGHQGTPRHPVPGSSPNFQQQFSNGGANLQQMRPGYPMQPENAPGYPSMPSGSMPSSEYRSQQRMPSPHPPSGPHVGYQSAAARPGFAPYPQPPTSMSSNRKPSSSGGVPLEKVIDDVAIMGFSREEVRNVLLELSSEGKAVDLNIVLDRLGAR